MKRVASIGAVVVALGCACVLAAAHGSLLKSPTQAPSLPWLANPQSNIIVIPPPRGNRRIPTKATARSPELRILTLPQFARLQPPSALPTVPADVYKTLPYSCLVVVPGPHPDDVCVINPPAVDSRMPIVRPDLRFIPRSPAAE